MYLRCLNALEDAGVRTISSQALAERFSFECRADPEGLGLFRRVRRPRRRLLRRDLKRHLRQISAWTASCASRSWAPETSGWRCRTTRVPPGGFEISALFDTLRDKVGQRSRGGVPIYEIQDLKKIVRRERISIAVIAVPACRPRSTSLNLVVAAGDQSRS